MTTRIKRMIRDVNPSHSVWVVCALSLMTFSVQAQETDFAGAFREMLPDVSYSADREMTIEIDGRTIEMSAEIVYTPYREWASIAAPGMQGMTVITVTDHMTGKLVSSVMGMNTTTEISPAQELANGHDGASFKLIGETPLNGVNVKVYTFSFTQKSGSEIYDAKGRIFLDDNGIPRQSLWTVDSDKHGTMKMRQVLQNIQVGHQDESLFALLDAPTTSGGSNPMSGLMAAVSGQAQRSAQMAQAPNYDQQSKSIRGQIGDWPGSNGRVIDDNGIVIGAVSADGSVTITATGQPGGIYPIGESSYKCDGTNLSDDAAKYQIRDGLAVVDASSTPIGRLLLASSFDVASWRANPRNNAATPGFTVRLVYVDRPTQSTGFCVAGHETQDRRLDFKPGWNIEKKTIEAVGDSPYHEPDQPTQIVMETVNSLPDGTVWVFENFSPERQQAAKGGMNLPAPIQEVVDEATDIATDVVKEEVNDKIRKGIRGLFDR